MMPSALHRLRDFTVARVGLARTGHSVTLHDHLELQLAHARARDAVHTPLDLTSLRDDLSPYPGVLVESAATTREIYLRRPDLGRRLKPECRATLPGGPVDVVFILIDGLSALALQTHAAPLRHLLLPRLESDWRIAPLVIATQGRVALGDDIGEALGAALSVVLIGERPGLSSPDSLGIYLTWGPRPGRTDAERNCLSNIRLEGLSYPAAAERLLFLMTESRRRRLSGVELKEDGLVQSLP